MQTKVSYVFVKFNHCVKENRNAVRSRSLTSQYKTKESQKQYRTAAVRNSCDFAPACSVYVYCMRVLYNVLCSDVKTRGRFEFDFYIEYFCNLRVAHDLTDEILIKFLFPRNRNALIMLEQT